MPVLAGRLVSILFNIGVGILIGPAKNGKKVISIDKSWFWNSTFQT